jgi:hypothetical protein
MNVEQTVEAVSAANLTPGDLQSLADVIDIHLMKFDSRLPLSVLSLMRAVVFILNGSSKAERVQTVVAVDLVKPVDLFAQSLTWQGAVEVLRRQCRFLRRLRRLAHYINVPAEGMLSLSEEAVEHVSKCFAQGHFDDVLEGIDASRARNAVSSLLRWVTGMYQVHLRQATFPSHFWSELPKWFPKYIKRVWYVLSAYVDMTVGRVITETLDRDILVLRQRGKAFGCEAQILVAARLQLQKSTEVFDSAKLQLYSYVANVETEVSSHTASACCAYGAHRRIESWTRCVTLLARQILG